MFKKIYIEITNVCNLKCKFCPDTIREKKFMNDEEFNRIINKIKKFTKVVCLHVKGEPLLNPSLDKILKIIQDNNLYVNITTNGTLLSDNVNLLNKYSCIRQINISLHSYLQNNSINNNYFENIFKSVDNLNKNIIISYRLWNLGNIYENTRNEKIIMELEKYYNINNLQDVLNANNYYFVRNNMFVNQDLEFVWPNINGKKINEKGRCLALKEQIAILVDGNVVPCCLDNNGDIVLGNIFNENLENIINSNFSQEILNNFKNDVITCDLCRTCGFLKRLKEKRKIIINFEK